MVPGVSDRVTTLCRLGIGIGSPKGHARATQASRKRLPRVDFENFLCLQQKLKKCRVGSKNSGDLVIARHRKNEDLTTD